MKTGMKQKDIETFFNNVKAVNALVIGDLMIDEYLWGKTERISPEAPVQVVDIIDEDLRLGGAGNVVNNLVAIGCQVSVCSVVGDDENSERLYKRFESLGVGTETLLKDKNRRTGKKTRVIAANQQIIRIDRESREDIEKEFEDKIIKFIEKNGGLFQVFIVSDYAKGVLTKRLLSGLIVLGAKMSIPIVVDPKGDDYSKYLGVTIITPNRKEAEQASKIKISDEASLKNAAVKLLEDLKLSALLITRSEAGMSLFKPLKNGNLPVSPNIEHIHIPTVAREVYDVTGAGDTVLTLLSLGLATGLSMKDAAWIANIAAGIAVGKVGTSIITPEEIMAEIYHEHRDSISKIKSLESVKALTDNEKKQGKRVVFTNGCFDLLHVGHVKYLQKARSYGDLLVLGLNSDASVRRLKGAKRPLIREEERADILAALDCIDYVVIFDEDTPLKLIEAIKPTVLVKGGDYTLDGVVGRDIVESYGGSVALVEFVDGKSTTNIIEKILKEYSE